MVRVDVKPELLRWARERARLGVLDLTKKFPKLPEWEKAESRPTLKQLEDFARRTHAPLGYFFLPQPPEEVLPIPDFRTNRSEEVARPSADLLDTIYLCQLRQDWYREYAESDGAASIAFIASIAAESDVVAAATRIRAALGLALEARQSAKTWEVALSELIWHAEELGVLVMRNGVVGNNTHRKLDRDEFRGFALSDSIAPLVFINAADSKSGQIFTLVHELVHLFVGRSALSDSSPRRLADLGFERWCNQVAAEFLVPIEAFAAAYDRSGDQNLEMHRLARRFKVSTLVVLRRMYDAGGFTKDTFWALYDLELERLKQFTPQGSGGDFHATEAVRVSRRFARALISSTLEGQTLYRDAFRLLGISKQQTFNDFSASLGLVT